MTAAGLRKGKLDLTTFEKLKKGSQKRTDDPEIVIAGKPDESHLVLRIKGEESPRMPQGGNNRLSGDAIARIEQWVKEGAKLDEGIDPKKPIKSYAASADQVARNQIARLPAGERDKKAETVGLERWKQANPKLKPEIVRGEHFLMFSNLTGDRAKSTIRGMETQYGHLKKLLGSASTDWAEKVSLYVFPSRKDFIEFVRTVETVRDVDADTRASAKLSIPQPYLAVVDPAGGRKDDPATGKRRARSKRGGEADGGSERHGSKPGSVFSPRRWARASSRPAATPRAGWRWDSVPTWQPRLSREASITANCGKLRSPISIRVGGPGLMRPWAEAIRSLRTAFTPLVSRWWKR